MKIRSLMMVVATASLASAGAGLAQGRGGGHGQGHGAGVGANVGVGLGQGHGRTRGALGADVRLGRPGDRGIEARARAGANARGPERASPRAIERANENSVLRGGAVIGADLGGLSPGLLVRSESGAEIGTVTRVIRASDGTIRNVLVRARDGRRTLTLAPRTLRVSGDVVTTSSTRFD